MPPHDDADALVELVLEEDPSAWSSADFPHSSRPCTSPANCKDSSVSSYASVRFCDNPLVYEIERVTSHQKQTLWYTHDDYYAMMHEAGVVPVQRSPFSTSTGTRTTKWLVRSLWIGSIVMGVLATSTSLIMGGASKRSR